MRSPCLEKAEEVVVEVELDLTEVVEVVPEGGSHSSRSWRLLYN